MEITVGADDVLTILEDARAEDVGTVFSICIAPISFIAFLLAKDEADIFMGDALLLHLTLEEMDNHGGGGIDSHVDTGALCRLVGETVPEIGNIRNFGVDVRQFCLSPPLHGVSHTGSTGLAEAEILLAIGTVRHHLQHVGIVQHSVVEEELLLCEAQVVILFNLAASRFFPRCGLEKFFIRRIVSHEEGFTTGRRQDVSVIEVIDEPQRVVEIAAYFQLVVDALSEEVRLRGVEVVIIRTGEHQATSRNQKAETDCGLTHV